MAHSERRLGSRAPRSAGASRVAQRPPLALRPGAVLSLSAPPPAAPRGTAQRATRAAGCRDPAAWLPRAARRYRACRRVPAGRLWAPADRLASGSASAVRPAPLPGSELPLCPRAGGKGSWPAWGASCTMVPRCRRGANANGAGGVGS